LSEQRRRALAIVSARSARRADAIRDYTNNLVGHLGERPDKRTAQ